MYSVIFQKLLFYNGLNHSESVYCLSTPMYSTAVSASVCHSATRCDESDGCNRRQSSRSETLFALWKALVNCAAYTSKSNAVDINVLHVFCYFAEVIILQRSQSFRNGVCLCACSLGSIDSNVFPCHFSSRLPPGVTYRLV